MVALTKIDKQTELYINKEVDSLFLIHFCFSLVLFSVCLVLSSFSNCLYGFFVFVLFCLFSLVLSRTRVLYNLVRGSVVTHGCWLCLLHFHAGHYHSPRKHFQ